MQMMNVRPGTLVSFLDRTLLWRRQLRDDDCSATFTDNVVLERGEIGIYIGAESSAEVRRVKVLTTKGQGFVLAERLLYQNI